MYFGEKYQDNDKAYDTDIYTRPEIERILKVAFEFAMKRNKHFTVVDKANVLASYRLWRPIAKEKEPQYPEANTAYMFIDNAYMRVLTEPTFFDVIVTENTFATVRQDARLIRATYSICIPVCSNAQRTSRTAAR